MDISPLLERMITQNEIIIRQKEKMLMSLAARLVRNDDEYVADEKKMRGGLNAQFAVEPRTGSGRVEPRSAT